MITVLHRGGYGQMITILHRGGGSLGTPKSDYVICARPLMATASLFVRQTSPAARPSLARIDKKRLRPLFVHLFIHRSQKSVGRASA